MNRGLLFYTPTGREWVDYNRTCLNNADFALQEGVDENSRAGVYLLASYVPAITLRLIQPDLTWCVDVDQLSKHETKINIGSSYFVMDRCILGPSLYYSDAAIDQRVKMYTDSFGSEVSNGLRWILQIYQTTNILQQHDLFNMDVAVAKNIRNKLAFESYTPVQLITELNETTDCVNVPLCTANQPYYTQQFGSTSGVAAPVGGIGQFTRPHLGAAPVTGFCSANPNNLAVRDPYVMKADDVRRLNELIAKNREHMTNNYFASIFRPTSGFGSECGNTQQRQTRSCSNDEIPSSVSGTNASAAASSNGSVHATIPPSVQPTPTPLLQPPVNNTLFHQPQLPPSSAEVSSEDIDMQDVGGMTAVLDDFMSEK